MHSLVHDSFLLLLTGRQEEDASLQQAEARETRRQYERSCKVHTRLIRPLHVDLGFAFFKINLSFWCTFVQTLEELTESYRSHCTKLANTVSQYSHTQEEVRRIRYVCLIVSICVCSFLIFCNILCLYMTEQLCQS